MNIAIQRPMKSPGDSGSMSSTKALMPPHCAWPSTTMCLTRKTCTAYSSAADTPCAPPSGWNTGTRLATLRTTNNSPGPASKITSGETRESQQPITMTAGDWPRSDSSR